MSTKNEDQRKDEILKAAQEILFKQNSVKISLNDIAMQLNITHAALYRYFKNKDDLWFSLAKNWLFGTESDLAALVSTPAVNAIEQLHTWITSLTQVKQTTYQQHPALFSLYTDMVRKHPELETHHLQILQKQILLIFKIKCPTEKDLAVTQAILDAFTLFYDPRYKEYWQNSQIRIRQENIWHLLSPQIKNWIKIRKELNI